MQLWLLLAIVISRSMAIGPYGSNGLPFSSCHWSPLKTKCMMLDRGDCFCRVASGSGPLPTLEIGFNATYEIISIRVHPLFDKEWMSRSPEEALWTGTPHVQYSLDAKTWMVLQAMDPAPLFASPLVPSVALLNEGRFDLYELPYTTYAQYIRATPRLLTNDSRLSAIEVELYGHKAQPSMPSAAALSGPRVVEVTAPSSRVNIIARPYLGLNAAFLTFSLPRRPTRGIERTPVVKFRVTSGERSSAPWHMIRVRLAARPSCVGETSGPNTTQILSDDRACGVATAAAWPVQADSFKPNGPCDFRTYLTATIPYGVDTSLHGCGCVAESKAEVATEKWVVMIASDSKADVTVITDFIDPCPAPHTWLSDEELCRCAANATAASFECRPDNGICCHQTAPLRTFKTEASIRVIFLNCILAAVTCKFAFDVGRPTWTLLGTRYQVILLGVITGILRTLVQLSWLHHSFKNLGLPTWIMPDPMDLAKKLPSVLADAMETLTGWFEWLDETVVGLLAWSCIGTLAVSSAILCCLATLLKKDLLLRMDAAVRGDSDASGGWAMFWRAVAGTLTWIVRKLLGFVLTATGKALWECTNGPLKFLVSLIACSLMLILSGIGRGLVLVSAGYWTREALAEHKVRSRAGQYQGSKQGTHNRLTLDITAKTKALVWLLFPGGALLCDLATALNSPPMLHEVNGEDDLSLDIRHDHRKALRKLAVAGFVVTTSVALTGTASMVFLGVLCTAVHFCGFLAFASVPEDPAGQSAPRPEPEANPDRDE